MEEPIASPIAIQQGTGRRLFKERGNVPGECVGQREHDAQDQVLDHSEASKDESQRAVYDECNGEPKDQEIWTGHGENHEEGEEQGANEPKYQAMDGRPSYILAPGVY